jgi:tRNA threonylcarbamoyladenosine modification (KEOPS) complex  Pcc1 subunit
MSASAKAKILLKFTSQKQIATILEALTPEVNSPLTRRANVRFKKDGLILVLLIEAEDTIALRATLNAYLHWINSTNNIIKIFDTS